jgi:hypothetical protein
LEPAALINKCRQGAHAAADAGRTAKERERGGEYLNSGGDSCESERWREAPPITGRSRKTHAPDPINRTALGVRVSCPK